MRFVGPELAPGLRGVVYGGEDVAKVDRRPGGFTVHHYPNRETRRACCVLELAITDEDRARASDLDPLGEIACLARGDRAIAARHDW